MVHPLAHLAGAPPLWDGVTSAISLVARGSADHDDVDFWRSYLIEVAGTGRVPDTPAEPVTGRRGAPVRPTRELLPLEGGLQLDGGPALPIGLVSPLPAGATVSGAGRAVVLERLSDAGTRAGLEFVELRRERPLRGENVLVLSGRAALARRWRGMTVIGPDHVALNCHGHLRPGSVPPRLVLVGELRSS
jgi:hypothetical protein